MCVYVCICVKKIDTEKKTEKITRRAWLERQKERERESKDTTATETSDSLLIGPTDRNGGSGGRAGGCEYKSSSAVATASTRDYIND